MSHSNGGDWTGKTLVLADVDDEGVTFEFSRNYEDGGAHPDPLFVSATLKDSLGLNEPECIYGSFSLHDMIALRAYLDGLIEERLRNL